MNFAEMILMATKDTTARAISNASADICIGTMIGTGGVRLEDGYEVDGEMVLFTQFCYDQVIELPYNGDRAHSHSHEIERALNDKMGITPSGPVTFIPAGSVLPPHDPPYTAEEIAAMGGGETLVLEHDHNCIDALPKIRLWRGVKDGDRVLESEAKNE